MANAKTANVFNLNSLIQQCFILDGRVFEGDKWQLSLPGVTLTKTNLVFDDGVTRDEWEQVGDAIGQLNSGRMWWIGEYYRFGRSAKWAQEGNYDDCEDRFKVSIGTAKNAVVVCDAIEESRRREKLSFCHHAEVAPLPKRTQDWWLNRAEKEGLSASELRKRIKKSRPPIAIESEPGTRSIRLVSQRCPPSPYRQPESHDCRADQAGRGTPADGTEG